MTDTGLVIKINAPATILSFSSELNFKKPILKLNKEWCLAHRMPKDATMKEPIVWYLEHSKHCSCGPIPDKLKAEIKKRKDE